MQPSTAAVAALFLLAVGLVECARKATTAAPASEGDLTDECPEPNGYFADGYQCDKYYECKEGEIQEKLCPDGMVFNDYSPQVEKCDLPFNIDCSQRPERQKPKPTLHCPRANGYFSHEDESVCDKFYFCVDGKFNMITCPAGLVYNEKTGICTWPDEAKKKGCSSQDLAELATKWLDRPKRLTTWSGEEMNSIKRRKGQEESRQDNPPDDYDSAESTPNGNENENESRSPEGFSPDPEFLTFDAEFEDFNRSEERESDEEYPDSEEGSDEEDGPPPDYEVNLDDIIKAYVEQMNGDPVQARGDLSYYEKIGELSIDKDDGCGEHVKRVLGNEVLSTKSDKVFQFECPKVDMNQAQQHPRYPDTEDCQFFYVCVNGESPRKNGCKRGQVFNEATGSCDWPRNVPECKDWYKGILTDEELYDLEHPKPKNRTSSGNNHRRKHPKPVALED